MNLAVKRGMFGYLIIDFEKGAMGKSKRMKSRDFIDALKKKIVSCSEIKSIEFDRNVLRVRGVRVDRKKYLSGFSPYDTSFEFVGFNDSKEGKHFLEEVESLVRTFDDVRDNTVENVEKRISNERETINLEREANRVLTKYMERREFADLVSHAKAVRIVRFLKENKDSIIEKYYRRYKDSITKAVDYILSPFLIVLLIIFSGSVLLGHFAMLFPAAIAFLGNISLGLKIDNRNKKETMALLCEIIVHYKHIYDISEEELEKSVETESLEETFNLFIRRDLQYLKKRGGSEDLDLALKIHNLSTKYRTALRSEEKGGPVVNEVEFLLKLNDLQRQIIERRDSEEIDFEEEVPAFDIQDPYLKIVETQIRRILTHPYSGCEKYLCMLYKIAQKYANCDGYEDGALEEDMDKIRGLIVAAELDEKLDKMSLNGHKTDGNAINI